MIFKQGYIHVYTGEGKGKTTASLGTTLRVLGSGGKVFYAQFIKGGKISSEFISLKIFGDNFIHKAYGSGKFIINKPDYSDIRSAEEGLKECAYAMKSGEYDLIVMDELNVAIKIGLIKLKNVVKAINEKHIQTELILTGRNADKKIIKLADLVTEMTMVKHYYEKGVNARKGIEM